MGSSSIRHKSKFPSTCDFHPTIIPRILAGNSFVSEALETWGLQGRDQSTDTGRQRFLPGFQGGIGMHVFAFLQVDRILYVFVSRQPMLPQNLSTFLGHCTTVLKGEKKRGREGDYHLCKRHAGLVLLSTTLTSTFP